LPVEPVRIMRTWYPPAIAAVVRQTTRAGIVHAHDSHAASLAALARCANPRLTVVCHRRVAFRPRGALGDRWKYRHVDRWIAVSTEIAEGLRRAGVRDLQVVHSAIDIQDLHCRPPVIEARAARSQLGIEASSPVIGLFGALAPQKGHLELIAAAPKILAAHPKAVFLCVGDGRLRNRLGRLVRRQGLGRAFRFTGFRRDVPTLMSLCSMVVVPSLDGEGSSAVIKEAVALGTPVIASDLPGNIEVLDDFGISVPVADADALAVAVLKLFEDSDCGPELGDYGRVRSREWAPKKMAVSMLAAYEGLGHKALSPSAVV
jgi:glycosyltransferase involved in cell wall biosynthesis